MDELKSAGRALLMASGLWSALMAVCCLLVKERTDVEILESAEDVTAFKMVTTPIELAVRLKRAAAWGGVSVGSFLGAWRLTPKNRRNSYL